MTAKNVPAIPAPRALGVAPLALAAVGAEEAGPDWRRIATALWRFKWLVLLAAALGIGAGAAATRVLSPAYVAQATVWIDVPDRRGQPERGAPIRSSSLLDADAWVDLLKSYVVLDDVVRNLRLYLQRSRSDSALFKDFGAIEGFRPGDYRLSVDAAGASYVLATGDGVQLERGAVGDSVGTRLGWRWAPARGAIAPDATVRFSLASPRDAARRLGQELDVHMDLNGNFLSIELRGPDPAQITTILNAVAERYVQIAAELKREKLTQLTKILDDQVKYAQTNLAEAEAALQSFRVQTITLPSDQLAAPTTGKSESRDPVFATFFDKQLERDQLRHDREAIERLVAQVGDSGLAAGALSAIQSVSQNADVTAALKELADKQTQLRALRYHYSEEYPQVRRLLGEIGELERTTIPTLARALAAQLQVREAELSRQVDASSRDLRQIPPRVIEEARLRRGVAIAEELYTKLQERAGEAKLAAEASGVPDVRILDPAIVPQRPVTNTTPRILFVALLGGLGLGVVGAILLDRLDPRVRYPEQVSRELGLPILGAVPHLRDPNDPAEVVEALRGVCLNLVHAHGSAGPLVITITSPGPGDGKSFLSANLALTFADGGHRTLLVDGDGRRGVLHRRFGAVRRPGLTDFLSAEAPREQILRSTPYAGLDLIGCGTRTHRAPELLGSAAMGQLLAGLRPDYDVILVDSPPLGAGVDAFILGTLTGSLLVVVRTGYSHRDVVGAKLEVLDRLPVRTLGAVLNDVPAGAAYGYYSYYLPGYEAKDEEDGQARRPPTRLV